MDDKYISISKAAFELGVHEDDLFNAASDGKITFHWWPRRFIHVYSVDMSTGEARYFNDKNPYPYYQPVDTLRDGYFEIDLTLCPSWKVPLDYIRAGGKGYDLEFAPIDPLVIREVGADGYIWSVTPPPDFDTGEDLDFPTIQTLGIFQKEFDRYKKQSDSEDSKSVMKKQENAILTKLRELNIPPKNIPESQKQNIEASLKSDPLFNHSDSKFKNAWQRLRDHNEIKTFK